MKDYFQIARVLKPQGIKGEIKVTSLGDFVDLKCISNAYIGREYAPCRILHVKTLNNAYVLNIDIIDSIETAEKYRNVFIAVDKAEYPQIFNDMVMSSDIIGHKVYDESNTFIGHVTNAEEYGASTVLTISNGGMSYDIPMVADIIWMSDSKQHMIVDIKRYNEVKV